MRGFWLTKEEREIVEKACEKPVKEEKKAKVKGEGDAAGDRGGVLRWTLKTIAHG